MSSNKSKKPDNTFKVISRLLRYMFFCKGRLVIVFICMILGASCNSAGTAMLIPAINDHIVPLIGKQDFDLTGFLQILAIMTTLYAIGAFTNWLQGYLMVTVSNDTLFRIRSELFCAMEEMPLSHFNRYSQGKVISLFSNDINSMNDMLRQSFPRIVNGIVSCVIIFIIMFVTNWKLAIIVLICESILVLILKAIVNRNSKHFASQQQELSDMSSFASEYISGEYTVKVFGQEENARRRFSSIEDKLFKSSSRASFFSDSIFNLTNGLSNIGFAVVAFIGALFTVYQLADIGIVGTFLQYYRELFRPMTDMSKQFNNILSALAGAERVFTFIDEEAEVDDGDVTVELRDGRYYWKFIDEKSDIIYKPFEGRIRFNHVNFEYEKGKPVLYDFTLDIDPGKKTAFVGTTGAGKTTVINLLSRFYEISSGTITIDDINVLDIKKRDLRLIAGVVLQEIHLFTGTISDNIKFGKTDASTEDIAFATNVACADSFINMLPKGHETHLTNNGTPLSHGHRQLLSLARTAITKAPILVLDEATSSVDTRTEMLINKGLDSLMENKTVLVVAHRLSTIKDADKIVVLDKGHIIECGNYSELMDKRGVFYRLNLS